MPGAYYTSKTRPTDVAKRRFVKLDAYALAQLGRENRLLAPARLALLQMVAHGDFRSREWSGSLSDLAEDVGCTWRTIDAALTRLEESGLVEVVERFGRNRAGRVRVTVYEDLVVPSQRAARNDRNDDEDRERNDRNPSPSTPAQDLPDSRATPAVVLPSARTSPALTCDDANPGGIEASREEGSEREGLERRERAAVVARFENEVGSVVLCKCGCAATIGSLCVECSMSEEVF